MSDNMYARPHALSIAGFDPSAGAGILADIKTFEAMRVYGLGVCTAITYQNEASFAGLTWISLNDIIRQIDVLMDKYDFRQLKIGLIQSLDVLHDLLMHLRAKRPGLFIIWDPILKASAGFDFHSKPDAAKLEQVCKQIDLITPNLPEALALGSAESAELNAASLSAFCNVFLKGGHHPDKAGDDFLFLKNGKRISFKSAGNKIFPKHGSGCILSSAIAARLAKGADLEKACLLAKEYTLEVLESNESLLGYHSLS
ncbi:MAG TPA: hydroxymethylpyrimidine/phosphomethylpyrimidine kinase [Bacteroidia bacterium]|jgi:hydroxymethylpyrimidine/phosphomethylpyrimidine kinase|nr:hydroxymethylpyrimidine/phosphomethylpyrimidine kinase [Bacteroidia bacterium]